MYLEISQFRDLSAACRAGFSELILNFTEFQLKFKCPHMAGNYHTEEYRLEQCGPFSVEFGGNGGKEYT